MRIFSSFRRLNLTLFSMFPMGVFAFDDKIQQGLESLLSLLTSTWGKAICSLAVVGVGFYCFVLGRIPVNRAITVILGTACIFGAPQLLSTLVGV